MITRGFSQKILIYKGETPPSYWYVLQMQVRKKKLKILRIPTKNEKQSSEKTECPHCKHTNT